MTNKHVDVLIIGGGAAGSAAALQLGRIRRSTVVVDAGEPRNAPAANMHGFVGSDGQPPSEFLSTAHRELETYGLEIIHDRVTDVTVTDQRRLTVNLADGDDIAARRILLATGLTDILPEIPGVPELWGGLVIHCPWCHGWETRDRPIAVIDTTGAGSHQALLFSQLSDDVVLIDNSPAGLTDGERQHLELAGVHIDTRKVIEVVAADQQVRVMLAEGESIKVASVAVGPRFRPNLQTVKSLDLAFTSHPSGLGTSLDVRAAGQTTNPKIYAAGNVADPYQQVLHAAADGSRVAIAINADLHQEDLSRLAASKADAEEWDDRYQNHDDQMWSGQPNGSLVATLAGTPAVGRALDVGCGEGADAVWLAEQGWTVSATDISEIAIERARDAARQADVKIDWRTDDLATGPPESDPYDLVTLSYPALRAEHRHQTLEALTAAVATGGHLLIIGHAHDSAADTAAEHGFDPAGYVSIDDIASHITDEFTVRIDQTQDRPNTPEDAHHTKDRILFARRNS